MLGDIPIMLDRNPMRSRASGALVRYSSNRGPLELIDLVVDNVETTTHVSLIYSVVNGLGSC